MDHTDLLYAGMLMFLLWVVMFAFAAQKQRPMGYWTPVVMLALIDVALLVLIIRVVSMARHDVMLRGGLPLAVAFLSLAWLAIAILSFVYAWQDQPTTLGQWAHSVWNRIDNMKRFG